MRTALAAALSSLLGLSCSPRTGAECRDVGPLEDRVWHFSEDGLGRAFEEAEAFWSRHGVKGLSVAYTPNASALEGYRNVVRFSDERPVNEEGLVSGQCIFNGTAVTILVFHNHISNKELLDVVLRHELGHSLGLRHVQKSSDIMSPTVGNGSTWGELDEAECRRVGYCGG